MRQKTATAVVKILSKTDEILAEGRPRKPLGKDRPMWDKDGKFSLPAALKMAKIVTDATPYQLGIAASEIRWFAYDAMSHVEYPSIKDVDNEMLDTRELRRAIKRAQRYVEEVWLS